MKKSVLITGASGFVGSQLVKHYLSNGFKVFGIDIKKGPVFPNIKYHHIKTNIINEKKVRDIFDRHYDLVIHLSGITRISDAKNKPTEAIKSNILATTILFQNYNETCKIYNKKGSFIFISTAELTNIYLGTTTPSIYSITKSSSEEILKNLYAPELLNLSIVRLCTVFGGKLENKFKVPRIFLEKIKNNEELMVNNSKNEKPSFIFIDDVIEIIYKVSQKNYHDKPTKIKTITVKGTESSLIDLVKKLQIVTNRKVNYVVKKITHNRSIKMNIFKEINKTNQTKFINNLKKSWELIIGKNN